MIIKTIKIKDGDQAGMLILRWQNKDYNHNHDDDDVDDNDQVLVGGGHELTAVVSIAWSHHPDVREALKIESYHDDDGGCHHQQ